MPLGFAPIPVDRVVKAFRRSILKMYGLPRKGAKARAEEEKPREQLGPVFRPAEEPAGLLCKIQQDCARIEHPGLAG